MLRLVLCATLCLASYTSAQADPVSIGGTATVSNFMVMFNWNQAGPRALFDVCNTSPAAALNSITFIGWDTVWGNYSVPLNPGETRSFSVMIPNVPIGTTGTAIYNAMVLNFQTPEPMSLILLLTGLILLWLLTRRYCIPSAI